MLPADLAHLPLDFDTLQPHGAFIGSAAVVVLSQHDRARDAALNTMRFFAHESCGQCTPCRVGTDKAVQLMQQARWDSHTLDDLAEVMREASICGLGQAAPNAWQSVQQHFGHELK
jgi:formate dehydrogenase